MAYDPITLWQIVEEKVEAVTNFILLGSKITVDGGCSHEIKTCLLLRRKAMTNLDSLLRSRDITLPTEVRIVMLWFFQQSCVDVRDHKEGFSSVQFSCSVVFNSLQPHESQHARPPCPSPSPRVHSDSCPSSP